MFWSFWDWLSNLIRLKDPNDYISSGWGDMFCETSQSLSPQPFLSSPNELMNRVALVAGL